MFCVLVIGNVISKFETYISTNHHVSNTEIKQATNRVSKIHKKRLLF